MIIIDEGADEKLVQVLETLRTQTEKTRCVYFKLAHGGASSRAQGFRDALLGSMQRRMIASQAQIYFCDDGDVFLLCDDISIKDARVLMLDMAEFAQAAADDGFAELCDLPEQLYRLLRVVSEKIERRQAEKDAQLRAQQQAQAQRKRAAILNSTGLPQQNDIFARRRQHRAPQLMMIEDDAFSRRLVENVLQKNYALTALPTAERALETYARLAPDVLFLDINLPDVTGHELLEKIIALDPEAYVVMLSGNADRDNIMQAMQRGAKGFVAKPFTRDKLFQYLDRCPTLALAH